MFTDSHDSHLPSVPPKVPKGLQKHRKFLEQAPFYALMGVDRFGLPPYIPKEQARHRTRTMCGITNRWRLPDRVGHDFLARKQANNAVKVTLNSTLARIVNGLPGSKVTSSIIELPNATWKQTKPPTPFSVPRKPKIPRKNRPMKPRVVGLETCPCSRDKMQTIVDQSQADRSSTSVLKGGDDDARFGKTPQPYQIKHKAGSQPKIRSKPKISGGKEHTPPEQETPPPPRTPETAGAVALTGTLAATQRQKSTDKADTFVSNFLQNKSTRTPDVLLKCWGVYFELHKGLLTRAKRLHSLVQEAETSGGGGRLEAHSTVQTMYYSPQKDDMINHMKTVSHGEAKNMILITVDDVDENINLHAISVALSNLYRDRVSAPWEIAAAVYAAANAFQFDVLIAYCQDVMKNTLSSDTACAYHRASLKFRDDSLESSCEKWLELNLVTKLATSHHVAEMPTDLMLKCLQANRLFVPNEFQVLRMVCYWLYFQLNPGIHIMPSYATLLTYFSSLPKGKCFLETEEGQAYRPIFSCLRIHGITDPVHMRDVMGMNIYNQKDIINSIAEIYTSMQNGGAMPELNNFFADSIRHGFILNDEPLVHRETFSLHGFFFELKAVCQTTPGKYIFSIQRLKPTDSQLTHKTIERSVFSMRSEREVKYCIRVQWFSKDRRNMHFCTGEVKQRFGLSDRTCMSAPVELDNVVPPIYVNFGFLIPAQ